ncbi:hypothetical protein OFM04_34180, partial [Escherichia coli]|nr:hypothetical protein [Escherichia coli]
MFYGRFGKNVPEIRCNGKIPPFVQLVRLKAFPIAINLTAFYAVAYYEHRIPVAVIRAAVSVFAGCPSEFAHGND